MLRALVLEDERPARSYLVELLEASGRARVEAALALPEHAEAAMAGIDVAFVDVNLVGAPGAATAGLDFIERMARLPSAPAFILTTADASHALKAFGLGVVDYLLKPFAKDRVHEALGRLEARRPKDPQAPLPERRVVARKGTSLVFIKPDGVLAFEAEGRLTFVHTDEGRFDIDISLAAVEASFAQGFSRVHRSWLVALPQVRALHRADGEMQLSVGTKGLEVPVARDRASDVRDRLLQAAVGLRRD
jgi:two-component system, LytTR family, response regulator LytT